MEALVVYRNCFKFKADHAIIQLKKVNFMSRLVFLIGSLIIRDTIIL
jgi:hypothetical protein